MLRISPMPRPATALVAALIASAFGFAAPAKAAVTFSATGTSTSGQPIAAAVSFAFDGSGGLTLVLTNTAATAPTDPASTLTGVFFNLSGGATLTPVSAILAAGSSIIQTTNCDAASCVGVTNVGGEWSYAANPTPPTGFNTMNQGIASSGYLSANANAGNFNGVNLQDPNALDGIQFGIVPTGFADSSGNGGLDNNALVRGSVTFSLTGAGSADEDDIISVVFQYGTSFTETSLPCVPGVPPCRRDLPPEEAPEPASLALLGFGLLGLGLVTRRRFG